MQSGASSRRSAKGDHAAASLYFAITPGVGSSAQIRKASAKSLVLTKKAKTNYKTTANLERTKNMKPIRISFKYLTALALLALAVGCATDLQNKENLAVSAGFKVITPGKPDQQALLAKLPADKVTRVNYKGKTYYVLPDVKNNQAYVGGPKQYRAYQQLRLAKQLSNENLEAAQMNEMSSMDWGGWGGWGGGWYGGWY